MLLHNGVVRPEGLFTNLSPTILVYVLSYKLQDQWVKRGLLLQEHLRLHQLPLYMDPRLAALNPNKRLPFEDAPSPEIYNALFCQLWGYSGGVGMDMI